MLLVGSSLVSVLSLTAGSGLEFMFARISWHTSKWLSLRAQSSSVVPSLSVSGHLHDALMLGEFRK